MSKLLLAHSMFLYLKTSYIFPRYLRFFFLQHSVPSHNLNSVFSNSLIQYVSPSSCFRALLCPILSVSLQSNNFSATSCFLITWTLTSVWREASATWVYISPGQEKNIWLLSSRNRALTHFNTCSAS
jgi:hypothetical protein